MPNWVDTNVTVYAKNINDIRAFIDKSTSGYHIKESTQNKKDLLVGLPEEKEAFKNYFSFGAITGVSENYSDNWYEEALSIWGTKWEARSDDYTNISKETLIENISDSPFANLEWKVTLHFSMVTAWDFPKQFWDTCSKQFPNLIFSFTAQEEGGFFLLAGAVNNGKWYVQNINPETLLDAHNFEFEEFNPNESWEKMNTIYMNWMDTAEDKNVEKLQKEMSNN